MTNLYLDFKKTQIGTGLIETMMIVLLVSVGIVAIIKSQHSLSYSTSTTQQQFDATLLATKEIETLRDFQVLTTTSGYTAYSGIVSGTSSQTVGNTTYTITWTITTNTNPNYKVINVTVSWTDRHSAAQSLQLISNVACIYPATAAAIK
jgi:Tfp pilus assembly protein PilV